MPRTKLEPDSQAEFEGGLLEGDRADADRGLEVVIAEYDTCVGAYSFGGIVLHCRPLAGGVLPECLGGSVAGSRIEADRSGDPEYPSGSYSPCGVAFLAGSPDDFPARGAITEA